jgi:hypothetical protein
MAKPYQNNLRLVKLLLNLHDRIRLSWILVLLNVCGDLRERNGGRSTVFLDRNLSNKVVEHLCKKREGRSNRVFGVGDDHSYTISGMYINARRSVTHQQVARSLHDCIHERCSCFPGRSVAALEACALRPSERRTEETR